MNDGSTEVRNAMPACRIAMGFVPLIGILSFTYEGARSVLGPYLTPLQASL